MAIVYEYGMARVECVFEEADGLCHRSTQMFEQGPDGLVLAKTGAYVTTHGTTTLIGWGDKLDGECVIVRAGTAWSCLVPVEIARELGLTW